MTDDNEDPEWVLWDWQPCRCRIDGADFDRVVGIEISGVYDGILFWCCSACGRSFQRWPEDHGLHARAQLFIDAQNRADEDLARLIGPSVFTTTFPDLRDFTDEGEAEDGETFGEAMRRLAYEELPPDTGDDDGDGGP